MLNLRKKEKTIKKPRNKNGQNLLGLVVSVLVAICVFIGLTAYQTSILSDYEKVTRAVAIKSIPDGIAITEENVRTYFAMDEIEAKHDVDGSVEVLEDLIGYVSKTDIANGQTVSLVNFVKKEHLLADVEDIVYVSFTVAKAGDAVGGTIREGNVIDVDVATTDGVVSAGEALYVNAAYDVNYIRLSDADTTPAVTIEVAISSDDAETFVKAINSGTAYVSRRG